ncbi:MAG: endonuclease MutS2 [Clostridia bacterium]
MDDRALRILEFDKIIAQLEAFASFSLGKQKAKELRPYDNFAEVIAAMKETSDAESCLLKRGNPPMGGAADIKMSLLRLEKGGVLGTVELIKIGGVLRAARNLKKYFSDAVKDNEDGTRSDDIIAGYISSLKANRPLEDEISNAIISEEEIADAASSELRSIRRKTREAQESIHKKLNDIIRSPKYQKILQDAIVTVKSGRYVVPVKAEHRSSIPGLIHDSSATGATIFIEPIAVVEANNKIKQLKIEEELEIERILATLSAQCAEFLTELTQNLSVLGQLDFVFAKAKLSIEQRGVCPKMNQDGYINLIKARHPLIEKNKVVPIDFWIGKEFNSVIVTGPNTGGKTVTLKTVGLLTLMVQAGLNIPAGFGTEMSVFANVFADIGDEQSIEQSLSTFSSHMSNLVHIIDQASPRALVLLDELGAGTDPTEGAALAMSILENLRASGATILATTHYSELKVYALATAGVENASCEFDVETLRPTYRLLIGVPGKSNAFAISTRLGLKDSVVERAKEFLTTDEVKFEDMILNLEKNRTEAEKERLLAEQYRLEAENYKNLIEGKHDDLQKRKDLILRKANEEAQEILENALKQASSVLESMREMNQQMKNEGSSLITQADELRVSLKKNLDAVESQLTYSGLGKRKRTGANGDMEEEEGAVVPTDLVAGEFVKILSLNQDGTVISAARHDGMVQIQVGGKKINIHQSNLRRVRSKKRELPAERRGVHRIGVEKTSDATSEIKVIGLRVEEATNLIDKFLDDCALANLTEVRIVHGKGSGALRAGVQKFLKHHQHVQSFRTGTFGEGDNGVTIVLLRTL